MCLFDEKLLSFKKSMWPRAKRSLKEPSRDALDKKIKDQSGVLILLFCFYTTKAPNGKLTAFIPPILVSTLHITIYFAC